MYFCCIYNTTLQKYKKTIKKQILTKEKLPIYSFRMTKFNIFFSYRKKYISNLLLNRKRLIYIFLSFE